MSESQGNTIRIPHGRVKTSAGVSAGQNMQSNRQTASATPVIPQPANINSNVAQTAAINAAPTQVKPPVATQATSPVPYVQPNVVNQANSQNPNSVKAQFKPENVNNLNKKSTPNQKNTKKPQYIVWIVAAAVVGLIVVVGLVVWLVNVLTNPGIEIPEIAGNTTEDIFDYVESLQTIYNDNEQNVDVISRAVDGTLKTENGKKYPNEVRLGQMLFYQSNMYYGEASNLSGTVEPEKLNPRERLRFYRTIYYCAGNSGDNKKSDDYFVLVYNLANELSGEREKEYEE